MRGIEEEEEARWMDAEVPEHEDEEENENEEEGDEGGGKGPAEGPQLQSTN